MKATIMSGIHEEAQPPLLSEFTPSTDLIAGSRAGQFRANEVLAAAVVGLANRGHVVFLRGFTDGKELDYAIGLGSHNPSAGRFDASTQHPPRADGVPYTEFGLVWSHMGVRAARYALGPSVSESIVEATAAVVEQKIVKPIDGVYSGRYKSYGLALSESIICFNPGWETDPTMGDCQRQFRLAVDYGMQMLKNVILASASTVKAHAAVNNAVAAATQEGSRIVFVDKKILWEIISPIVTHAKAMRVVVKAATGGAFIVYPILDADGMPKIHIPEFWRNMPEEQLSASLGIDGILGVSPWRIVCRTPDAAEKIAKLLTQQVK